MNVINRELVIIGAGPGGYVAAIYAAKKGLKVTLIDKSYIGGTCLNVGCIPTKSLVHSATLFFDMHSSAEYGVFSDNVKMDLGIAIDKKEEVRKTLVDGISFLLNKYGVEVIKGKVTFVSNHRLLIASEDNQYEMDAINIIIATGSMTKHLPIKGIHLEGVVDSEGLLQNKKLPKKLTVIGGGIIGMEFAFIYGMMGVEVQVIEFLPSILPMIDRDVSQRLIRFAKMNHIEIQTSSQVTKIERLDNGNLRTHYLMKETSHFVDSNLVLEAVGRGPVLEGYCLEYTTIESSKSGIIVNTNMKTNVEGVYAIGDVTGIMQLAHVASHQALVAVDQILGIDSRMEYDCVPSVIFTNPQIASVGKTETQLKNEEIAYRIFKVPFSANGRALINGQNFGFIKFMINQEDDSILGAEVFGNDAEHLIGQITVMMKNRLSYHSIKETIFAHPTTSELIHESVLGILKEAIHFVD